MKVLYWTHFKPVVQSSVLPSNICITILRLKQFCDAVRLVDMNERDMEPINFTNTKVFQGRSTKP